MRLIARREPYVLMNAECREVFPRLVRPWSSFPRLVSFPAACPSVVFFPAACQFSRGLSKRGLPSRGLSVFPRLVQARYSFPRLVSFLAACPSVVLPSVGVTVTYRCSVGAILCNGLLGLWSCGVSECAELQQCAHVPLVPESMRATSCILFFVPRRHGLTTPKDCSSKHNAVACRAQLVRCPKGAACKFKGPGRLMLVTF
jgi:hypothetical protein